MKTMTTPQVLVTMAILLALGLTPPRPAQAQTSEYFLMAGDQSMFHVIQGGVLRRSWSVPGGTDQYQYPIAVIDTIRTTGADADEIGAEYDLSGNLLGPHYTHPSIARSWDGTTDGTYNYTIGDDGGIHRHLRNWGNPILLFGAGSLGSITYDPSNDSLWVGQWDTSTVINYTDSGVVLSSFDTGHTRNMALALDHADGTLWLHDKTTQGTFEQWTRTGSRLQRIAVAGMNTQNALGGEMPLLECRDGFASDHVESGAPTRRRAAEEVSSEARGVPAPRMATGGDGLVVFDFEDLEADANYQSGAIAILDDTKEGVTMTLTREGGVRFDLWDAVEAGYMIPPTWGRNCLSPFFGDGDEMFVADFNGAVLSGFYCEFGDFGADFDCVVELEAYDGPDGTGSLLATASGNWDGDFDDGGLALGLWVFADGIRSVKFVGGSFSFPSSLFSDNLVAIVPCVADLDGSGAVDFGDILAILGAWGNAGGPEDLNGSGTVDFGDLLVILGAWGQCP